MAAGRWVGRGDKNGGDGAAVDAMRQLIGTRLDARRRRDRRGREGRGAHAVQRRGGGQRRGPGVRRRGRPDRRHHADGQGHARTRSRCSRWPSGARCSTRRRCSTWRSSPSARRRPTSSTSRRRSAENIRRVAEGEGASSVSDVTVCVLDRPRHADLVAGDPAHRRAHPLHLRRRRRGRDLGGPPEHRRRPALRHRRHPGGDHRRGRAEVHGRRDAGQAVAARRRGARAGRSTPGTTWTGCSPPTTSCAATTCSSAPPASPTATCCAACTTGPGGCTTQSIVMRSKSGTVRMIDGYHRLDEAAGVLVGRLRPHRRAARRRPGAAAAVGQSSASGVLPVGARCRILDLVRWGRSGSGGSMRGSSVVVGVALAGRGGGAGRWA